jgi:hypothetical protein
MTQKAMRWKMCLSEERCDASFNSCRKGGGGSKTSVNTASLGNGKSKVEPVPKYHAKEVWR